MVTPPRIAISRAATTKVYGRRKASLTIHISTKCEGKDSESHYQTLLFRRRLQIGRKKTALALVLIFLDVAGGRRPVSFVPSAWRTYQVRIAVGGDPEFVRLAFIPTRGHNSPTPASPTRFKIPMFRSNFSLTVFLSRFSPNRRWMSTRIGNLASRALGASGWPDAPCARTRTESIFISCPKYFAAFRHEQVMNE